MNDGMSRKARVVNPPRGAQKMYQIRNIKLIHPKIANSKNNVKSRYLTKPDYTYT